MPVGLEKTRMMPLPDREIKFDDVFKRDKRTDRFAITISHSAF